jgi:hypothetical protein
MNGSPLEIRPGEKEANAVVQMAHLLEELKGKVDSIEAHLQSGTTLEQGIGQMINLLAATLLRMERLENKVRDE